MSFVAPVKDMMFVMTDLAGLAGIAELPGYEDASVDTAQAILEENARFVSAVIAPLNRGGDVEPSTWKNGKVTTSPGFREAYEAYRLAGWQGLLHEPAYGGQGLPKIVATPCIEMLQAANLSFALCPLLTDGAIEALMTAASQVIKDTYLAKLVSGAWTGTMNLTEPQAGSDLALVRTRAVPEADGRYRIFGQKIFITYGEHDLAENIIHLVLARTPGAPEGVKGISLFVVPKHLVGANGVPAARNDVYCASIEHKLGIKASPTAVLVYGDDKGEVGAGAIGEMVGEENRGLEYMFIMMNAARFQVGMQGVAIAERAYQQAAAFAKERVQGRDVAGSSAAVSIIHHPDVRRMLMSMRAQTEAARALAYVTAATFDISHHHPDADQRRDAKAMYEFLVPIVKGWSTEMSIDVASMGVQVHGGMGFIEETGAAQHYRDARILTIYEGTTAIQANDFVGRKTLRDGGATARGVLARVHDTVADLTAAADADLAVIAARLSTGADALGDAVEFMRITQATDVRAVYSGSVPYLKLAGIVLGGWQMARAALAAKARLDMHTPDKGFCEAKRATARFFADTYLTQAQGLRDAIVEGSGTVFALAEEQF